LPPASPPLLLEGALLDRLRAAEEALTRLAVAGAMVPSIDWFLYAFVRKEAVLSSQIEGTQATLTDLLTFEANQENASEVSEDPDVEEVCNYVEALTFAREELATEAGLPLSMRLLHETHRRLMQGVRGEGKSPGEVRRSQNWIGGSRPGNARFVPPPPQRLAELLSDLERYIHDEDSLPPLVRAGLVHVQFETIHPYLDGNGRIGRLLISLLLEHWRLLPSPLLYLSLFFKRHQAEYYRRLECVRTEGDWEGWLDFFLDGVAVIGSEAIDAARDLFALVTEDRARILAGKEASVTALRVFESLPAKPIVTVAGLVARFDSTKPTIGRAIDALEKAGVLVETTGKQRDRVWSYDRYVQRLRSGEE
jgi:Fic family protein